MTAGDQSGAEIPPQRGFVGVFITALVILGLCVWNYWYLVIETNDRVPEAVAPFIERHTSLHVPKDKVRVGVYDSSATRRFFREMRFNYADILGNWKTFLRRIGFGYHDFFRIDRIGKFDVVIFPFTSCLSDYEASKIKEFVGNGGRILMTGAVGSRYEDGRWRDEPVFGDIIGARFVGNANPSPSGPARLILDRETPVSLRLTPRHILGVPIYNEVLVVRPIGPRMTSVAKTKFSISEDRLEELTAFNIGPYLEGKVAWSGFRLGAFPSGNEILERAFHELFSNTLAWLAERPRVTMPLWPGDFSAALGIVVDLELDKRLRLLDRLSDFDQSLGILVTPSEAQQLADFPGFGGIDVEWILHLQEDYLRRVDGLTWGWLANLRSRMESVLGKPVRGIRFDTGNTRQQAEQALAAGFSYLLAPPTETIEEYPEIYASRRSLGPFEPPVVISLAPFESGLPERFEATDCSFAVLSTEEFLGMDDSLGFAAEHAADLWVAEPGEIVDWRAHRNSVLLEVEFLPGNRLRLGISNGSYHEFEELPFRIHFNRPVEEVDIWPKAVGDPPPRLLANGGKTRTFVIENFRPGMDHVYILTPIEPGNPELEEGEY